MNYYMILYLMLFVLMIYAILKLNRNLKVNIEMIDFYVLEISLHLKIITQCHLCTVI
jgi:hypothetical protein